MSLFEIRIRQAEAQDAPAVAQLLYESFVEFRALYTSDGFAATALNANQAVTRLAEGPVWLAFREDRIPGTVAAVVKAQGLYMRGMAVLPTARGSGVGARLLKQSEQWARSRGCDSIFLNTTPFLSAAIQLYQTFGFRRTDDEPHELFGTPLFTMVKHLSASK
jgi:GNAT superfamily N-acetyltransferase